MIFAILLVGAVCLMAGIFIGRATAIDTSISRKQLMTRMTTTPTGPICQCGHAQNFHFAGSSVCKHITLYGINGSWICDCQVFIDRDGDIKAIT